MKWYFLVILSVTILSVAGLLMIAFRFDPFNASRFIRILFLGSFFIALWGVCTLLFSGWDMKRGKIGWEHFFIAFRRGFLASIAVSLSVILGRLRIFNALFLVLILGTVLSVEWLATKKYKEKEYLQDFN